MFFLAFQTMFKKLPTIKAYIQWAENYVQHSPYLFVYYDLATAYESLGNREKAWDIYRYSKHLYPGAKWRDEN